jgi:hypothetical protein
MADQAACPMHEPPEHVDLRFYCRVSGGTILTATWLTKHAAVKLAKRLAHERRRTINSRVGASRK